MSDNEHPTPGPWYCPDLDLAVDNGYKCSEITARDDRLSEAIAVIPHDDVTDIGVEVVKANARLIAAVPKLLAACRGMDRAMLLGDYGIDENLRRPRKAMEAAIVEAVGSLEHRSEA